MRSLARLFQVLSKITQFCSENTYSLYFEFQVVKLKDMVKMKIAKFMIRFKNKKLPVSFKNYFTNLSEIHKLLSVCALLRHESKKLINCQQQHFNVYPLC